MMLPVIAAATKQRRRRTLLSVAITPDPAEVLVGDDEQLAATATYSDGTTEDVTNAATWASSDETKATVSATGLLSGVAEGSATITATLSGIEGSATANVVDPFDALGTLVLDLRSTRGVDAPSNLVATWADQAAPAQDFTQSTSGSRAAYVDSGTPKGKPCIRGSSTKYMLGPSGIVPSMFTLFVTMKRTGASAFGCVFNTSNNISWLNGIGLACSVDGTTLVAFVGRYDTMRVTWASDTSWHVVAMTYNGTTLELFVDGVSKGTASATISVGGPAALLAGIATATPSYAFPFVGDVADVKLYDGVLSGANRAAAETLLTAEYIA